MNETISSENDSEQKKYSIRRTVRLNEMSAKIVEDYAYKNKISQNEAINILICSSFPEEQSTEDIVSQVADKVADQWEQNYGGMFRRIYSSTHFTDINVEVEKIILNSIALTVGCRNAELNSGKALLEAEQAVKDTLSKNKQNYDSKG